MPNIKDLFNKHDSSGKVLSGKAINQITSSQDAESFEYIEAYQAEKDRFIPEVDFTDPKTFVRYGSAEKYYENAIQAIYRTYPYDGSRKEKTEWHNSASYFDNYVFNEVYPRTNGYYVQGQTTFPAVQLQPDDGIGVEFFSVRAKPLYIDVKGGPHKAAVADTIDQQPETQTYSKASSKTSYSQTSANIYDAERKRASNFAIDGTEGNTIEMWVKPSSTGPAVLFDLWNDDGGTTTAIRSGSYGRFLVDRRFYFLNTGGGSGGAALTLVDGANFHLTYMSGTAGAERVPVLPFASVPQLVTGSWSHLAFSVKNEANSLRIKTYFNGELIDSILTGSSIGEVTGALNANIGGYKHYPDNTVKALAITAGKTNFNGYNQLTGAIDEFRFWKTGRSSKEIGRNWFTQVFGGTNTDNSNTDLGVYFKFNEGITQNSSYDSVVLDYSGRISNGTIVNYDSTDIGEGPRLTGSAMVESSASLTEFKDPIIYSFHPQVFNLKKDKSEEGSVYDARNSSAIHTTLPNWMSEDDQEVGASNLAKIVQVMASYFDTLQLQLDALPHLKDVNYTKFMELKARNYSDEGSILLTGSNVHPAYSSSFSSKPKPFTKNALQSLGLEIPEIFTDADAMEQLSSRDEDRDYKDKLYNIKNQIYQNIYNNLNFILKSKGTEKSFRNLVRCFGVDEELVRLNLYGNNVDYELKNNFRSTAVKKTYVDFMDVDRQAGTVYHYTSSVNNNTNAFSYIPSNLALVSGGFGMTFQTEVYFPFKGNPGDPFFQPFEQLSSSLFGMHTAVEAAAGSSGQADTTWNNPDVSEFKVYAIRPEKNSRHAYFQLTSSVMAINLTSSVFDFVYDNEKWNFAVRVKPTKYPWANALTGTNSGTLDSSIAADTDLTYEVSFYGAHADLDIIVDEFNLSTTVNASVGDNFMSGSKRMYIGAHRTNFSGGLLQESDVKISTTRAWMDYLTDAELRSHAKDANSKGVLHPHQNAFVNQNSVKPYDIPRSDLLIFEWDFTNVTSSDGGISGLPTTFDARFVVEDISSGSTSQNFASDITDDRYGGLTFTRNQYTGRGDFFEPNNEKVVDHIYINSAKIDAPEVINSSDMIEILNQDDLEFTRESRPIDYFYAVEKSMYQTISDEMLRVFATIADFNNLIGEPVNRYRGQYKDMDKLKSLFYESIGNTPDLDKYVDFYKWIDAAITKFLEQIFPASANFADELRTVVESHVLERSAYRNKFPTLEVKQEDPEVPALGINELTYNWKFGHAPTDVSDDKKQKDNCLWFNQRAEKTIAALSSSVASVNTGRQTILDRATTDNSGSYLKRYEGSTYVLRKLSKPYKEGVSFTKQIKGGVNFDANKKVDHWKGFLQFGNQNVVLVTGSQLYVDDRHTDDRHCADNDELRNKNKVKSSFGYKYSVTAGAFLDVQKINTILPFNLYTTGSTTDVYLKTWESISAGGSGDPKDQKVVVVNHHHDGYGTLAEEPMQGTFTERWEGGNPHRHVRINDGRDITTNSMHHRPEAWKIVLPPTVHSQMQFRNHHNSAVGALGGINAPYYRDFIAKRPVVIKNILQTTATVDTRLDGALFHGPVGNYSHQHDIVQTSGRKANNKYFVEQEGVGFGKVFSGLEASPQVAFYNVDYKFPTPERKATDTVFVERFSAPGSFEAMNRGFLDPFAEEMSVYNAMPFRNLSVRGDSFKKIGAQKGGGAFTSTTPSDYDGQTLTITSQDNNKTVVYIFLTSGTTGDLDGSGRVKVVLSGGNPADYVVQLIAAINSANGHNAGVTNSVLGLTSVQVGVISILGLSFMLYSDTDFVTSTILPAQVEMSTNTWSTSSLGLRSLLSRRTRFGGYDKQATTTPAFHKTYRNRKLRLASFTDSSWSASSSFDNAYVTHMIPRTDFQYSWIRSSRGEDFGDLGEGGFNDDNSHSDIPLYFGYAPYSGEVVSKNGNGFVSAIHFQSASEHGSYIQVSSGNRLYGINKNSSALDGSNRTGFIPVSFVGLNTNFVDTFRTASNTITETNRSPLVNAGYAGKTLNPPDEIGLAAKLNGLNLRRNGTGGFSSWKQIRQGDHPIARHLKDTNTYSISVRNKKTPVSAGGIPYGPEQIVFPKLNVKIVGNEASYKNQQGTPHLLVGSEVAIENYIEPPLSSKFKPIRHDVNVEDENAQVTPLIIEHTYTNNFDYFANPNLMKKMEFAGVIEQPGQQIYDNLLDYTIKGTIPKDSNPIKGFRNLIYKETIYPKEQHTYLAKSRGRTSYTQEVLTLTGILGSDRTFWRDSLGDRQRSIERPNCAKNPLGFLEQAHSLSPPIVGTPRPEWVAAPSIHPLDVGDRMTGATIDYSQLTGSNHGALSVDSFSTSMLQYQIDRTTLMAPTSSFAYEYHAFISSSAAEGGTDGEIYSEFIPNWDTQRLSGKKPWFDSYEHYASDIRLMGQDHTVLPEFRISQHMDYYLDKGGFFGATSKNNKFLTLEGGHLSQSAASETSEYDANFYDVYSHSDFLKHFELIRTQHEESLGDHKQTKMTIKCRGIKKLLPYNGFYPMNRTVQLGSMMSQSFAPFLEGSTIFSSNPNAERISAFMQPFFNPGIMYNTIKSGIAVDWMTFTGSVHITKFGTSTQGGVIHTNTGSFRLPFESIIFPEKYLAASGSSPVNSTPTHINYVDARMHTGAPRISGAFARWTGDSKPNYSLAVNNFMAEIPNFFLKDRKMSALESTTAASFLSGVDYYMDVDLYKTKNMVMYEGPNRLNTTSSTGNNASARGIHYGPPFIQLASSRTGNAYMQSQAFRCDPANAAYTPPYFYGKSTARVKFSPHEFAELANNETLDIGTSNSTFTLEEIVTYLATSGTTFFNDYSLDQSGYLDSGRITTAKGAGANGENCAQFALATKYQMQIQASMNLFNVVEQPIFAFDSDGRKTQTEPQASNSKWVISPKFECPVLNFSGNTGTTFADQNLHTRGMWRGYGEFPTSGEGIYIDIKETFPTVAPAMNIGNPIIGVGNSTSAQTNIGSLKEKLFPNASATRIGEIADEKEIFEAVVAIPFTVSQTQKQFFPLVPASDAITAKFSGQKVVQAILGEGDPFDPEVYDPGHSIIDQVEKMKKYVFPPQLDFINNKNLSPMQMYIFEFSHTLSKQDLADIWQGVMPEISVKAEKQTASVTHLLTNNELMLGRPIDSTIRWMVFKVKQRAEYNYNELILKTIGRDEFVETPEKEAYSYNWPYDFFSLVELVKIDTGVQIGGAVPKTPPDISSDLVDVPDQDEEQEKTPDLAKNEEFTPADAKDIFLPDQYKDRSEGEQNSKMTDIGNDPIL